MFLRRGFTRNLFGSGSNISNDESTSSLSSSGNNEKNKSGKGLGGRKSPSGIQDAKGIHIDKSLQGPGALAQFDACVEACDALAASGGHTVHSNGIMNKLGNDGNYALNDCSIMVSPDGALLFLPRGDETAGSLRSGSNYEADHTPKAATAKPVSASDFLPTTPQTPTQSTRENKTTISSSKDDLSTPIQTHTQFFAGEDYESAVVVGNDLTVGGDLRANGFAAKGWNPERTSKSLHIANKSLQSTLSFMEELALSRKNCANYTSQACDRLRDVIVLEECPEHQAVYSAQRNVYSSPKRRRKQLNIDKKDILYDGNCSDEDTNNVTDDIMNKASKALDAFDNSISPEQRSKLGPLQFPGSTLHAASIAVEQYHSMIAEGDAHRWRLASSGVQNRNIKLGEVYEGRHEGLLPELHEAISKLSERTQRRESAFNIASDRAKEAEETLSDRKKKAQDLWEKVKAMEEKVQTRMEEQVRERSRAREEKRRKEQNERQALIAAGQLDSTVTQQEIWELVSQVSENMDGMSFAPTGLPTPSSVGPIDQTMDIPGSPPGTPGRNKQNGTNFVPPPSPGEMRDSIEYELGLPKLRKQAVAADEDVDDAACALLNTLSAFDTTKRSARIAAESCLLSAANSQARCLRSMLEVEKASIRERLNLIQDLEKKIEEIDVRSDLERFIDHEKRFIADGRTRLGEDDDGGIASALAVLNSHSEGVGIGVSVFNTSFSGWKAGDNDSIHRDDIEESVEILFEKNPYLAEKQQKSDTDEEYKSKREEAMKIVNGAVKLLIRAVQKTLSKGRSHRASVCYALNNQRGVKTYIESQVQFDGLCSVLDALLTNCDREAADIASAKMCMMLSQTFYQISKTSDDVDDIANEPDDREKRIYPKTKLVNHPIWSDEDFWVQALFQCVTESLTQSGVMSGFEKEVLGNSHDGVKIRKVKWYDLSSDERLEAASQVHAVIFAQLGALAHSMVEFGCDLETACAFVRRLSIRHQLPLSHRSMLLKHLIDRNVVVNGENQSKLGKLHNDTINFPNNKENESNNLELPQPTLKLNTSKSNEKTLEPVSPPITLTYRKGASDKIVSHNDIMDLSIPALADEEERDDGGNVSIDSEMNPVVDLNDTLPVVAA